MKNKDKNKLIEVAPDSFVAIPRDFNFINKNMATRIEKDKRKKSRKREKQDFLKSLREQGII
jgi:hypothetical protein